MYEGFIKPNQFHAVGQLRESDGETFSFFLLYLRSFIRDLSHSFFLSISLSMISSEMYLFPIVKTNDPNIDFTFLSFERTLTLLFQLESNEEEEVVPLLPLPASLMSRMGFNRKIVECNG